MLHKKSLTELRGIAQSFGIADIFTKDAIQLAQDISLKQTEITPDLPKAPPMPQYDARLMTKVPRRFSTQEEIQTTLADHVARGLTLTFPEPELWKMRYDKREDTGTVRQPLRNIHRCADRVLNG